MPDEPLIAYLFSRYPVVSQTFCDTEMLALERHGARLEVHAIHPPDTSFRHAHLRALKAPVRYAPPAPILKAYENGAKTDGTWPASDLADDASRFGEGARAELRMRNALHLASAMQRGGVRHVHVHFANRAAHTALYIHRLSGIPFSFTAHAQDFLVELPPPLLAELVDAAEFVVAVSDHTRGLLADRFPEHAAKIHRVHNGIDLARFPAQPHPHNRVPLLLGVGRLVPFKGFLHLVRACGILRNRGLAFRCEIIGEGPQREELEREIAALGVGDAFVLRGTASQGEIASRLSASDVFVLPCDIEPDGSSDVLPTVITEAMAAGRPVVSCPVAGVPELVVDCGTGLLTPRAYPEALAAALFRLLADHELRRELGSAGRARVEQHFRVEQTSAQLLALLRASAGRERTPAVTAAPVDSAPEEPAEEAGKPLALLLSRWPDPEFPSLDGPLSRLLEEMPAVRVAALACPTTPAEVRLAPRIAFTPDAMVLEGLWREADSGAHAIERLRSQLPAGLDTADYLAAARQVLDLRGRMTGILHLHAVGERALLCAWILNRVAGVSFSAHLPAGPLLSRKVLEALLAESRGGWCADPALAEALKLDPASPLSPAPAGPLRRLWARGAADPAEWIRQLRAWT